MSPDWSKWVTLSPSRIERRLRRRLNRPVAYSAFVRLYNALIGIADQDLQHVIEAAGRIGNLLRGRHRRREALLFMELEARSRAMARDLDGAFEALRRMIELDDEGSAEDEVIEVALQVWSDADRFGSSLDHRPRVLSSVADVLTHYGRWEEVVSIHLDAAVVYSRHDASQAAYRSLDTAERIARRTGSPRLLARTLGVAASTAYEEGDFAWSVSASERCLAAWEVVGEAAPASVLSNLGVARMNLGHLEDARRSFEEVLSTLREDDALRPAVLTNLVACLRRSGDLDGAWTMVRTLKDQLRGGDPEHALEGALVSARVAADRGQADALVAEIREAVDALDALLAGALRLHHRRGLRARFTPRIERLMDHMSSEGDVDRALTPIAAIRCNGLCDWLSILDWADAVERDERVPDRDKAALVATLGALRRFGAPHLYGFREKYDDAWSPSLLFERSAWDDLSSLAARLALLGLGPPHAASALEPVVLRCRRRLKEGHCLMAVTHGEDGALLWCLLADRYVRVALPKDAFPRWNAATSRHAFGEVSRRDFNAEIQSILDDVWAVAGSVFDRIADAGAPSVRFVQDSATSLPLTALALRHRKLARRMATGDFHVRMVSALYVGEEPDLPAGPDVAAIFDADDGLLLPRHEGRCFAARVDASRLHEVDVAAGGAPLDRIRDADVLLVSTHSTSMSSFTDPFFARMGSATGRHPINVERLQETAPEMRAALVMLNACHSGVGSARNFYDSFETADAVSFPSLFALNGRAIVSAASWSTSDTVGFIHAQMVADGIRAGRPPANAVAGAIGTLPTMTKSEALEALASVEDEVARDAARARLESAPELQLFSRPYVSGGLAVHGLL